MKLDYFLQIIDELNKIYFSKQDDEEIICTANVNGIVYNGTYSLDSFNGKETLVLNKDYKYNVVSDLSDENKSFIDISKINAFTYRVHKNFELEK